MDLRQLEVVREVVDTGSVSGAAHVLHCTPSAVSQQLRAAERSVGVALVERDGRGVRPTAAGRALAAEAARVAVAVERARSACAEYAGRTTGEVRVASFQSAAELLYPRLLTAMGGHDGIVIECTEHDVAQDAFPGITADADLVIAHRPLRSTPWSAPGLHVTPLFVEALDVAVSTRHPLAAAESVAPEQLVGEPWITVRQGFPIANVLHDLEARTRSTLRVAHRINDFHVIEALVADGHGVALLPRYTSGRPGASGFRLVPLRGMRAGRRVEVLARADRMQRRVVRTVLRELRTAAAAATA